MAIRPTFRVGILLAVLYPFHVGSLSYKDCHYAGTSTQPGFVTGFGASLSEGYPGTNRRRRTRVDQTASGRIATAVSTAQARPPSSVVLQPAHAGSFAALPTRECCVGGSARERRRRSRMRETRGGDTSMGLVVHFNPTEFDDLVRGIGQAVFLGLLGALIPKWTRERIREKEAGLEADERFEMGLDQDEDDEFGYAEGYVCGACDNTNEVECSRCGGKGFFVSESALPKRCRYCAGLGTVECPDCDERREILREEREQRRPRLRLPPSRDEDFPLGR